LAGKQKDEQAFRKRMLDEKELKTDTEAYKRIAAAQKALSAIERQEYLLERGDGFDGELFVIARHLGRLAAEKPKASADRLREYGDARLASLKFQLFSPAPIYPELERARLAGSFSFLAEQLGGDHPLVVKVLAGKSPADRAAALIANTKLADVDERKRLEEGGRKAIDASEDALILLAKAIDEEAREVRKKHEEQVEEPLKQAMAKVARARFELLGTDVAPDATFTLRLAFGVVKGYRTDGGEVPFATTFGGAFARAQKQDHREPFVLPKRWLDAKDRLDTK